MHLRLLASMFAKILHNCVSWAKICKEFSRVTLTVFLKSWRSWCMEKNTAMGLWVGRLTRQPREEKGRSGETS